MPWQIKPHPELSVVETVYEGDLTARELAAAVAESVRVARGRGWKRLLSDCTRLEGGHGFGDLYQLAADLQGDAFVRSLREAVLAVPGSPGWANASFYETTCFNRGLLVRVFAGREPALEWLRQS